MPPTEPAIDVDSALLERAKLALQSLQFEEQAARYRAATAALVEAIADAQAGNPLPLRTWLDQRPIPSAVALGFLRGARSEPIVAPKSPEAETSAALDRLASHHSESKPAPLADSDPRANAESDWTHMAQSANLRLSAWHRTDAPQHATPHRIGDNANPPGNHTPNPSARSVGDREGTGHDWHGTNSHEKEIPREGNTVAKTVADKRNRDKSESSPDDTPTKPPTTKQLSPKTQPTPTQTNPSKTPSKPSVLAVSPQNRQPANPFSEDLRASLVAAREKHSPNRRRAWWMTPPFWVSCGLHGALLVAFAYWVITAVQPPPLLSIVAANVDSEAVLTETPMEMPSDLEQTPEESPSLPHLLENPATLAPSGLAPSGLAPDSDTIGTLPSGPAGLTSGLASEASKAIASGSRLVPGTEFFGTKAVGNTFVYVVDCSPSMLRDGAFDEAKREILRSLASMKPKQRFHIAFFGKEINPLTFRGSPPEKEPVPAIPENLAKTMEWIERVEIQKDGRPPIDALRAAIAMQPDGIFLLFDGDTKVKDWTTKITELNRSDDLLSDGLPVAPIHVVHFFREEYAPEMESLAKENQGTYRFIPRPTQPTRNLK